MQAKTALAQSEWITARDLLRPLLTGKRTKPGYLQVQRMDPAELRWLLAEAAHKRGSSDAAVPVYWSIWTKNPTSRWATEAEKRLISMGHRVPDSTTASGRKKIASRAATLRKMNLHKEAIKLLDQLPKSNETTSVKKQAYYAFSAKDYPRATTLFRSLKQPKEEDLYHLALATARTGDYETATAVYTELFEKFPRGKRADTASYKVGYMAYDKGNLSAALSHFASHLRRYPTSKHADETRFFMGWSLTKLQRNTEAKTAFSIIQKKHFKSSLAPAAAFWHARLLELEGSNDEAKKGYDYLLRTWPNSGYAWFASQRNGADFPLKVIATPPTGALSKQPSFKIAAELSKAGYERWAQLELASLEVPEDRESKLIMAHAWIAAGHFRKGKALARPYCVAPWKKGDPVAQQACYPRPHADIIDEVLEGSGINPLLPYAIMTAESGLRPEVSSPAGARGLMQLMPSLAQSLHPRHFPNQPYDPDLLYGSGYNATLGTTELRLLAERYNSAQISNVHPLVIAGYNGGTEAVDRWLSTYEKSITAEEFSEDIGYTETRRYVRRVLGYLMTYQFVYGINHVK